MGLPFNQTRPTGPGFSPAAAAIAAQVARQPVADRTAGLLTYGTSTGQLNPTGGTFAEFATLSAQVAGIGSGTGAALNFAADDDNTDGAIKSVTFVGSQTSTYASTAAEDGTRHQIADTASSLDIVYQFSTGTNRNAAKITFKGYVAGVGDSVTVQAYNGSTWDTRATISGQAGTTNITRDISLLSTHTGTGTDAGKVFIRFISSDDTVLQVDELLASAVSVGSSTGYSDGAVWVKATGTSGTTPDVNGTADNPCPWADALTIATAKGLSRFRIVTAKRLRSVGPAPVSR